MGETSLHALVDPAVGELIAQVVQARPGARLISQPDPRSLLQSLAQAPGTVVLQARVLGAEALAAVEGIRKQFPRSRVPILMLIEGDEEPLRDACLASGASEVAVLPMDPQRLSDALSRTAGSVVRRSERIAVQLPARVTQPEGVVDALTSDICLEAVKLTGQGLPDVAAGLYQVLIQFTSGPIQLWARTVRTEPNVAVAGFASLVPTEVEALKAALEALGGAGPHGAEPGTGGGVRHPSLPPLCSAFADAAQARAALPPVALAALTPTDGEALAGQDAELRMLVGAKLLIAVVDHLLRTRPSQPDLDWSVAAAKDAGAVLSLVGNRIGQLMLAPGDGVALGQLRGVYGPLQRAYLGLRLLVDKATGLGPIEAEQVEPARTADDIKANAEQRRKAVTGPVPAPAPAAPPAFPSSPEGRSMGRAKGVAAGLLLLAALGFAGFSVVKPRPLHLTMTPFPEMSYIDFEKALAKPPRFNGPATEFFARLPPAEVEDTLHRIAVELSSRGFTEGTLLLPGGKTFQWPGPGVPTTLPPRPSGPARRPR